MILRPRALAPVAAVVAMIPRLAGAGTLREIRKVYGWPRLLRPMQLNIRVVTSL